MARRCGGAILEVPMFKNGTPLWREAHFEVKMHKTPHCRSNFGSSDVQKWYAAMARSSFWSQNAQNTTLSEQFWKFRCSKIARRCGAKPILKSNCTKHHTVGAILEVPMFKNRTPLWPQAHFEVKMRKTPHVRTTFWTSDVQNSDAAVAPSTFVSQTLQKTCVLQHFERFLTDWLTN